MTCAICGDFFSWQRMEKVTDHLHVVLENGINDTHPCGVAIRADVDGAMETFLCLVCAKRVGDVTKNALKRLGVSS